MNEGSQTTISQYVVHDSPGHDAWNEGTEPFVGIEVMSAEIYAKPA